MTITPFFPPQEGELTQGYFARMGHLHAQTDTVAFLRYVQMSPVDFRDGTDRFIDLVAELTGADQGLLERNTLKSVPKKSMSVAGQELSPLVVRRSVIRVCCECLLDDMAATPTKGASAFVFKRDWLFRQVVRCPVHHSLLVETPAPDPARVAVAGAAVLGPVTQDAVDHLAAELHADLSVQDMACDLGMSPRQLQRAFATTGETPTLYLLVKRLEHARRELEARQAGKRSGLISTIAYEAGFSDLSYFQRCFRKAFGSSPKELA